MLFKIRHHPIYLIGTVTPEVGSMSHRLPFDETPAEVRASWLFNSPHRYGVWCAGTGDSRRGVFRIRRESLLPILWVGMCEKRDRV